MIKSFDVTDIPPQDFTLEAVNRRYVPLKYTPDVIHVTPQQHKKVMSSFIENKEEPVLWDTWRGIPIKHKGQGQAI